MVATFSPMPAAPASCEADAERPTSVAVVSRTDPACLIVSPAFTGAGSATPVRVSVPELGPSHPQTSRKAARGGPLSEDDYFGLPSSYLEYEWQ